MPFWGKKSWLDKQKEELKRLDEKRFGNDIELEVNIKDERTLILFLGAITGGINNNQLIGAQKEYVSNMQEITRVSVN